jgi:hypothetical protein
LLGVEPRDGTGSALVGINITRLRLLLRRVLSEFDYDAISSAGVGLMKKGPHAWGRNDEHARTG